MGFGNGQDINPNKRDFINGLARSRQLLNLGRLMAEAAGNAFGRPAEALASFNGHESMNHFGKNMSRGETSNVFVLDSRKELFASRPKPEMSSEVIKKCVGIQEDGLARGNVVEGRGPSNGSFSTS